MTRELLCERYTHHLNSNLELLFKLKPQKGGLAAIEIESLLLYIFHDFLKPGHKEGLYMFSNQCDLNSSETEKNLSLFLLPMYLKLMILLCREIDQVKVLIGVISASPILWIEVFTFLSLLFICDIYNVSYLLMIFILKSEFELLRKYDFTYTNFTKGMAKKSRKCWTVVVTAMKNYFKEDTTINPKIYETMLVTEPITKENKVFEKKYHHSKFPIIPAYVSSTAHMDVPITEEMHRNILVHVNNIPGLYHTIYMLAIFKY